MGQEISCAPLRLTHDEIRVIPGILEDYERGRLRSPQTPDDTPPLAQGMDMAADLKSMFSTVIRETAVHDRGKGHEVVVLDSSRQFLAGIVSRAIEQQSTRSLGSLYYELNSAALAEDIKVLRGLSHALTNGGELPSSGLPSVG